jgi:hypothetical protein
MMNHQTAPQDLEAFFQELELSDERNRADWNKSRREARLDGDLKLVRKLEIEYDLAAEAPDAAVALLALLPAPVPALAAVCGRGSAHSRERSRAALLALTRKPVPMMCVEERFRRALAGGRAPQQ